MTKESLARLVQIATNRQVFFGFWGVMVGGFVLMMYQFIRKTQRRNFREPGESGPQVRFDPRLPKAGAESKDIRKTGRK